MRTALEIVFWVSAGLIVWTQLGYAAALAVLARVFARGSTAGAEAGMQMGGAPPPARRRSCR
jgi:hypothetical protein